MTEYGVRIHRASESTEEWFGEDRDARDARLFELLEEQRAPGSTITALGQLDKPDLAALSPVEPEPE
jgi:hypothetical protein